jgi:hypothetical protein
MMKYNDLKLAKQVPGIDLILGGHDHLIVREKVAHSVLVKSGTDFRHFSIIRVVRNAPHLVLPTQEQLPPGATLLQSEKWLFQIELKEVHHAREQI